MSARLYTVMLVGMVAGSAPTLADENNDLDLIPSGAQEPVSPGARPEPQPTIDTRQRIYLEDAFTLSSHRSGLIVPFPPQPANWQERIFLDVRKEWALDDRVNLSLSDRVNFRAEDGLSFPSHENAINDFREGFASWEALDRTYFDAGRINLKSGVAAGFNPTDFFKTRAVVEPLSADPAVLREDRLGTLMFRAQHIWEGGAITAAMAPAFYQPSAVYNDTNLRSIDPSFDRTNAHDRFLLKASADLANDFGPELLLYREGNRTTLGTNLTESLGQSVVAYAEWAGGDRSSLIDTALRYGRQTGTVPVNAPSALPEDSHRHFQNDLSIGGSYTTETKITFNLEYHFHQAGFSRQDWDNWFAAGSRAGSSPIARQLWFIRAYALDQQEPISEHSVFLRADWVDAFIPDLELTSVINTDLYDGSSFAQITADYYLSNSWTIGALASVDFGRRHSDFGSQPQVASVLFKVARYF